MSVSITYVSDDWVTSNNFSNNYFDVATGVCATRTKLSKPIYTHIKHFSTENGNKISVTNTDGMRIHTGRTSSHACSLDSLIENDKELDKLIEFHASASEKENRHYYDSEIPLSSSEDSDALSDISWLDPKSASQQFTSQTAMKDWSKHSVESEEMEHNRNLKAGYEIRISIQETPKRVYIKQLEGGRKIRRKPVRLANLTRKIRTKGMDEVKITKKDVQFLEPNSGIETFDIKKYLTKTRRKLSFPFEDSFKKSSSSSISSKFQEDSLKMSSSSSISSTLKDDFNLTKNCKDIKNVEKRTVDDYKSIKEMRHKSKEYGGSFLLKDYLSKLEGIATKPPTTKRAKAYEQRPSSRTYFDFDDYCNKLFYLKEKFNSQKNKGKTI